MKRIAAGIAGLAMAAGGTLATTAPAQAQPLVTGGLVNVTVTDVIDDVTVVVRDVNVSLGAALGIAANVCDVNVNVLAEQLRRGGATCTSDASGETVDISQI